MESTLETLAAAGWVVLRGILNTQDQALKSYIHNARKLKPIFNTVRKDHKRLQTVLPSYADEPWATQIVQTLSDLVPKLNMRECAVLHSLAGCKKQRKHSDFNPVLVQQCTNKPHSLLIAISDQATLHVWENHQEEEQLITLEPGDGVLFRGDVVHAGAAYARANTRLFAYLDSPELKREPDTTHFPTKVWCYCSKPDDHEVYIECAGKSKCPYNGWVHKSCAQIEVVTDEPFWCKACSVSIAARAH